ncbi:hypothetical protein LTR16_000743 [Cryomyces antarcticus]|uniref:Uncharacterized protein n=1 Tax=Cryomyces antarcticus TaxID=329879 RepID=A0ABR0KUE1_9PEZI|nr:hypothetical protein LTR39_000108 [Cryomyces antarcticus]KAK5131474.1 hypothetical protein LTR16_000743 [Cryomyces antarcticus]
MAHFYNLKHIITSQSAAHHALTNAPGRTNSAAAGHELWKVIHAIAYLNQGPQDPPMHGHPNARTPFAALGRRMRYEMEVPDQAVVRRMEH